MTKSEQILIYLGKYKYLTLSQFEKLGEGYHYTQKLLKTLVNDGSIGVVKYAGSVERANFKAENIYFLTQQTAKLLISSGYKAQYPRSRKSRIGTDFKHRIYTVNIQLSCESWAINNGFSIELWKNYFSNSNDFETATKIETESITIIPDFITLITGRKTLRFVGELTNGHEVKLAIDKIKQLQDCAKNKLFTQYGWDKTPRVLCVMETENLKRLTIERFNREQELQSHAPMFLFSTISEVTNDFDNWVNTKGELIKLSEL
jgi:hypothetical protein